MLKPAECAEAWKKIVEFYKNTRDTGPEITIKEIVDYFGFEKTREVFATVTAIKRADGRIYDSVRKYMEYVFINPACVDWNSNNPMLYAGLDEIHTTHINQLMIALMKEEGKKEKVYLIYEKNYLLCPDTDSIRECDMALFSTKEKAIKEMQKRKENYLKDENYVFAEKESNESKLVLSKEISADGCSEKRGGLIICMTGFYVE